MNCCQEWLKWPILISCARQIVLHGAYRKRAKGELFNVFA